MRTPSKAMWVTTRSANRFSRVALPLPLLARPSPNSLQPPVTSLNSFKSQRLYEVGSPKSPLTSNGKKQNVCVTLTLTLTLIITLMTTLTLMITLMITRMTTLTSFGGLGALMAHCTYSPMATPTSVSSVPLTLPSLSPALVCGSQPHTILHAPNAIL